VTFEIHRLEAPFGAEILGLDRAGPLNATTRQAVNAAFNDNVVLVFRDQRFATPDAFLKAACNLGEPMPPVTATYRLAGYDVVE
jgi:taurine dioxygenase